MQQQGKSRLKILFGVLVIELAFIALFAYEFDSFWQYAAAYKLLLGKKMYVDFNYQQMPLLAFVYAAFFYFTGVSLFWGRMVGLFFGLATVGISVKALQILNREAGEPGRDTTVESLLWAHLFIWSPALYLVNYDTKTFFVSFLMTALLCLFMLDRSHASSGVAGAVAALLGLIKLTYIPLGALYLAAQVASKRYKAAQFFAFTASYALLLGGVVGYFYHRSPELFYFMTVTGLIATKRLGFDTTQWVLGMVEPHAFVSTILNFVTGYLALPLAVLWGVRGRIIWNVKKPASWGPLCGLGLLWGVWMFIASTIIPGQGNGAHYFSVYMPAVLFFFAVALDRSGLINIWVQLPALNKALIFSLAIIVNLNLVHNNPLQGSSIPRINNLERMISQYRMARAIRRLTPPNAVGFAYPRYGQSLFTAQRDCINGNETTDNYLALSMNSANAERFHLMTRERENQIFTQQKVDFIVIDNKTLPKLTKDFDLGNKPLPDFGYVEAYADSFADLYVNKRLIKS